ncbi:MAG: hypothetical protein KC620_04750 [Myxococcales bacterium]|nr:hypothetical protein [Myxococcales bacterium]
MSSGAASDAAPPAGGSGVVAAIDAAIARVERWLVTVIALVMTTTVFLDIVFRAFGSPESQLAEKAVRVLSWFGVEPTTALYETLREIAVLVLLVGLAFYD